MEDFTGGVVEAYDLKKTDDQLFTTIQKATEKKCLMSCSLKADPKVTEAVLPNGLVKGHAYTLTGVKKVSNISCYYMCNCKSGHMHISCQCLF